LRALWSGAGVALSRREKRKTPVGNVADRRFILCDASDQAVATALAILLF
jgi:hypothetical protein